MSKCYQTLTQPNSRLAGWSLFPFEGSIILLCTPSGKRSHNWQRIKQSGTSKKSREPCKLAHTERQVSFGSPPPAQHSPSKKNTKQTKNTAWLRLNPRLRFGLRAWSWSWTKKLPPPHSTRPQVATEPSALMAAKACARNDATSCGRLSCARPTKRKKKGKKSGDTTPKVSVQKVLFKSRL